MTTIKKKSLNNFEKYALCIFHKKEKKIELRLRKCLKDEQAISSQRKKQVFVSVTFFSFFFVCMHGGNPTNKAIRRDFA